MKIKPIKKIFYIGASLAIPFFALAAVDSPEKVLVVIDKLSGWMFSALLAIAVVFILIAAYTFLGAGGDAEKIKKAKDRLLYAVIAVALAVLATSVVKLIQVLIS